jgi:hypothetical protein
MRPKLATLMQHLKAANARIDKNLKAIEEELLQATPRWRACGR